MGRKEILEIFLGNMGTQSPLGAQFSGEVEQKLTNNKEKKK